jgi:UDP-N-acetylglucosamine diphosphorylase/glucosamine-1-phosphate N-acetyltransferase
LEPGCVLDASRGPIVLAEKSSVGANAVLQGPCYIGAHSAVTPLSLIRPGVSVGQMCKIGGEVSNSILLGYTNKAHEGFLGDSYLGKWVNFGAGTTTSNLKNTYGQISVRRGDQIIPTGRRFLGALVGDHSKTGILTRLAAGAYVGFCASIAGEGPPTRFVPSYTFENDKGRETYDLERALDVTRRVYARRDRPFTNYDEHVMRYVAATAPGVER